jgi:hypothetical protein
MVLCSGDNNNEKDGSGKGDDGGNEKDGSGNANDDGKGKGDGKGKDGSDNDNDDGIGNHGMGRKVRATGLYYSHIRVDNHI